MPPDPPLPHPDPQLFGYFNADFYEGVLEQPFGNLDLVWTYNGIDPKPTWGRDALLRAIPRQKFLLFGPDFNPGPLVPMAENLAACRATILAVQDLWGEIDALFLDEPPYDLGQMGAFLDYLDEDCADLGLAPKPWWVNFTGQAFENATGWQSSRIAVLGLEVGSYMDPRLQNAPDFDVRCTEHTLALVARIDPRPFFLVLGAYARNGLWTNRDTLRRAQFIPYGQVRDHPSLRGVLPFSLGRPDGTLAHGTLLLDEHRKIWEALAR